MVDGSPKKRREKKQQTIAIMTYILGGVSLSHLPALSILSIVNTEGTLVKDDVGYYGRIG